VRGVSYLIDEGGIPNVLETVLSGFDREVKEVLPLRYRCRCSRERLLRHLILLSAEDRDYLREEDGAIDADCVFCGEHYRFTQEELQSPTP
jgi:molecular chaperone Hsp33